MRLKLTKVRILAMTDSFVKGLQRNKHLLNYLLPCSIVDEVEG